MRQTLWSFARSILILAVLLFSDVVMSADLILTAPPREKPDAGEKLYSPLAAHLSKLLKKEVKYVHPGNWLNYQRDMRADKYDIIFDGPHFISWRMTHLGHEVLVKLPGTLEFYLVAAKDNDNVNKPTDLVARHLCGISPPNLSTLTVISTFPNPVRQPVLKGIKGGMGAVYKSFKKGDCEAAVLRTTYYKKKLKPEDRAVIKIIHKSPALPNQGISASRRLSARDRELIIQSLTFGDGVNISQPIVKRFAGKKAKSFITAKTDEYQGHNQLLEGVIFGW